MRGLRKYLTPFAPDQSGAVSVLFELGGLLVICDAGGCTGNICGFDEPRWFRQRCAMFSAGLRDMDAILGQDEKLVQKIADAAEKLDVAFVALIGTPVPAVIGTDYRALKRMLQKRLQLPVLIVETTGTRLFDRGEEEAWLELFKAFASETLPIRTGRIGIIGATPQELSLLSAGELLKRALRERHGAVCQPVCYGMGDGLDAVLQASEAEYNLVVAPSGLKAARYLKKKFGTPYEIDLPLAEAWLPDADYENEKILVVHQQVEAAALRRALRGRGACEVIAASWFLMDEELTEAGDVRLSEEENLISLVQSGGFDRIIADPAHWSMIPDFSGAKCDLPQFSVSGRLMEERA